MLGDEEANYDLQDELQLQQRALKVFGFLDSMVRELKTDSVHQNPLKNIRTEKCEELQQLVESDAKFRGMMEVYNIFRDIIS